MRGVVLYGPPASGKSTVTAALTALDPRFVLLRKLKAGIPRGSEYEFVSFERLAELRAARRLLVESHRYGNAYAVDRHQVEQITEAGQVPVVHMGTVDDVRRLVDAGRWLVVLLWVSREMCERRSRERGDDDTAERLRAWDETLADLHAHDDGLFACRFQTDEITSAKVARLVAWIFADQQAAASPHRADPVGIYHA
ncbi:guanylate kinase [Nonomuraea sp. MCN248]|uniref:Guanylate kinase n=1 Tax=Nonomuraea corallina TaxID=2989783 RepID=A0ABT4S5D4_9ACTN|nr:guanylate kinase [Nonomuraea corallina]MDA0632268.1 guanylate kinase [Nonomuraea corallina]